VTTVYFDSPMPDSERRELLYSGDIFVFSPSDASRALCDFARSMLTDAFAPHDPREAQYHMPVEEFVARFAPVKPAFIHHPETMRLLRAVVEERGADPNETFLDVPRLRGVTSDGYLTSGVGYAHHPHRDTWYSAPMAQLNWWVPIYDFASASSMAFHPRYFDERVENGSSEFNYYEWNAVGRREAAKQIGQDVRKQPKAEQELELEPELRVVCPTGGVIVFSAAHLHSAVPNDTGSARFSMDFRTVNASDLDRGASAPNLDSEPTGTSLRDFVRLDDLSTPVPDELVARFDDDAVSADAVLVFAPPGSA
jgi:hypothetical protein